MTGEAAKTYYGATVKVCLKTRIYLHAPGTEARLESTSSGGHPRGQAELEHKPKDIREYPTQQQKSAQNREKA